MVEFYTRQVVGILLLLSSLKHLTAAASLLLLLFLLWPPAAQLEVLAKTVKAGAVYVGADDHGSVLGATFSVGA